jgi:hypothetical protein
VPAMAREVLPLRLVRQPLASHLAHGVQDENYWVMWHGEY